MRSKLMWKYERTITMHWSYTKRFFLLLHRQARERTRQRLAQQQRVSISDNAGVSTFYGHAYIRLVVEREK